MNLKISWRTQRILKSIENQENLIFSLTIMYYYTVIVLIINIQWKYQSADQFRHHRHYQDKALCFQQE